MSRKSLTIAAAIVVAALAGLWAGRHLPGASAPAEAASAPHAEAENPKRAESGVSISPVERERAGIATAAVRSLERQAQSQAIATALPLQELIDAAAALASARAQADRATSALAASRRDFERLRGLHAQDRNVSDRALDVAEAAWRADEAGARSAQAALDAARASARGRWGAVLADAMAVDGPLWRRLAAGQGVLLRVAASGAVSGAIPAAIEIEAPDGRWKPARQVSIAPIADPRIQGTAFFYDTDAKGIAPGMTLAARFGAGEKQAGALLPADALLWWQGRQWAYVEEEPGRFERREAVAARRVDNGWFVPGFEQATVVSRGAQALLSQELRSTVKVGEEEK
ncbi:MULTISPECIES: hypothetical protein [Burkholderiaceae]|jgi:hypothetical protein|uniref:Metal transporter n=1 Tax=Pandoraea apista TaxID=93218 RepID=A0A5E5P6N3_9BURK|nr:MULTISPECIES: hypothetical protein [Burkholderiaceae]MBR8052070.1 hypothetical protein [Burkholderia vietnamiensis]VVG71875.1 metal transporter [Pandoraea apista]